MRQYRALNQTLIGESAAVFELVFDDLLEESLLVKFSASPHV